MADAPPTIYDVIIVGGGPAGLSAALVLGRCRRRVLVIDEGRPRNRWAVEMHGYLSRDCIAPAELLRLGRAELVRYGVEFRQDRAERAWCREGGGFGVELANGERFAARRIVLATGLIDELPEIDGLEDRYGISVHHCPYCDGWEHRDQALAAYGRAKSCATLALTLRTWSADVVALSNGPADCDQETRDQLRREGIRLIESPVARLDGEGQRLERIVFQNGESIAREALFFSSACRQASALAGQLGCRFDDTGGVITDDRERTHAPGVFLIGDASRDVQFIIVAAAEGARAAVAINTELQREDAEHAAGDAPERAADAASNAAAPQPGSRAR